jgi:hypothetical protein
MDTDKKRISFDFDNTIELDWVQIKLFAPLSQVYDVVILTSRSPKDNKRVWKLAEELGIPKDKVYFTNHQSKCEWVDKLECILHFDDDFIEINDINESCKCKGILINYMMSLQELRR